MSAQLTRPWRFASRESHGFAFARSLFPAQRTGSMTIHGFHGSLNVRATRFPTPRAMGSQQMRVSTQRGWDLRGSPERAAARSAAVGRFRPSHQAQPAVTAIAPTKDPIRPLIRRSTPSPDNKLINNPPMKEPSSPATIANVQSTLPCFRPTISWATAPTAMPNTMIARMSMHRA
jgi:hypothetical protein